jgi:hypothetical protein
MLVFDALSDLDDTFILSTEGKEKEKREGRFTTIPVDRIPGHDAFDIYAYSERSYFGARGHPAPQQEPERQFLQERIGQLK